MPTRAAYKMAGKYFGQLQTTGVFADDHPAIQMVKAGLDQAKAASDESVPLSMRIRAGQNQIAMHERDLKAANGRVLETEQSILAAQQSLEQHRAKVLEFEKSLQERRNHLEQLHRQAAAEASHGPEATQLQVLVPDGINKHLPQKAKDSLKKAADLRRNAKQRQQQKRRPHVRRKKRWSWTSSETSRTERLQRLTPLLRHESTKSCRLKSEATQRDWQSCGRKWLEISARRFPRRDRSKGSARRKRTSEISIVTIYGNFWTTHAEWMAQVGPRHLPGAPP